jgi:hypothetical protein
VFKVLNQQSGGEFTYEEVKDRLHTYLEQQAGGGLRHMVDGDPRFRLRRDQDLALMRLDVFLHKVCVLRSRTLAKKLRSRKVTLNGEASREIRTGDVIHSIWGCGCRARSHGVPGGQVSARALTSIIACWPRNGSTHGVEAMARPV